MNMPFWGFCSSPVVFEETILVAPGGYGQGPAEPLVVAYDKTFDAPIWKAGRGPGGWAAATVQRLDAKPQLLVFAAAGVVAMTPERGEPLWTIPWRTAYDCHVVAPIIYGSTVFVTSGYNTGCRAFEVHGKQVTRLWDKNKVIASCSSDPVIIDGFVSSFSGQGTSGKLKCLDLKTGRENWTTADLGNGSLVWVDGCWCCLSYSGKLALVEARPAAYHKLAEMKVLKAETTAAYTCPIIATHNVYLRHGPRLACYRLTEK
jgi:hypothetical protein